MRLCSNCCHIHLCFDVNVFYGMTLTRVFGRLWVGLIRMHLFFYACVVLYWHTCRTLNIYLFLCHTCFHVISHPLLQNLRLCYIVAVSVYSFSKIIHNMTHASFRIHNNVWVFAHLCDLWFHVCISERMCCFRKMHACDVWRIYRYFVHMWIFVEESVTFCVRNRKFCTHVFGWSHACVCFDAKLFLFCAHVCNTPRMRHLKATLTSNVWHTWLFRLHICLFAITSIQRKSTRLCLCRC